MGADPQYLWWRPTHFSGESPCGDSERNGMWTAVAGLAIPLVCLPRYGLRAGVTVDLLNEEGSRYPRARTIPQRRPTCAGSGFGPVRAAERPPPKQGTFGPPGRSNGHGLRLPLHPRLLH